MLLEKNKTQIKIIDFGISRKLRPNEPTKETFGTPEFVGKFIFKKKKNLLLFFLYSIIFSSRSNCI
jgi:serine/threonine protein kinase